MIELPGIFKDKAVFQQKKPVHIWGETDQLRVGIALIRENCFHEKETVDYVYGATKDGVFHASLRPRYSGGPFTLLIQTDEDRICLEDIYFGEVWLAGGQSNMELELQNSANGQEIAEQMDDPMIRYYQPPKIAYEGEELARAEKESVWQECVPENVGTWSAVALYFAREIAHKKHCMVGIIGCNWGGTSASCWTSREYLEKHPRLQSYLNCYDQAVEGMSEEEGIRIWEEYKAYQTVFDENVGRYYQTATNPTWAEAISLFGENRYPGPLCPRNETRPYGLHDCMLSHIAPYTLAGFLFYQGENDDNRPYDYEELLSLMIEQWRDDWRDASLPFLMVQLPVFLNEGEKDYKNWPFIREAQSNVASNMEQVGLAVILEKGEAYNIHPLEKETVGKRLAMQALYKVYGLLDEGTANGPQFGSFELRDGEICIHLKNAREGLILSAEGKKVAKSKLGFEVAAADGKYYKADQVFLEGSDIILKSKKVTEPRFARYFWKNYGTVYIYGANGIPLAPFRTSPLDGAIALGSRQGQIFGSI